MQLLWFAIEMYMLFVFGREGGRNSSGNVLISFFMRFYFSRLRFC